MRLTLLATVALLGAGAWAARGGVAVSLTPVADASLIEVSPTNNNGAQVWVNAGTTQNGPRNRGLFRFNPAAVIPTNALILGARVVFELTGQPAMGETIPSASFGLHRMLRPWGEGTKTAGPFSPGQGQPASPGEVTWTSAFHPTNHWAAPGGLAGTDYVTVESASTFIEDIGNSPYGFGPTPELAADVQGWLRNPAANFGWMLRCADEGPRFTARRFASREDVNRAPQLQLEYLVPPRIESIQRAGDFLLLSFHAETGHIYDIESRDSLAGGDWRLLASLEPLPASGPVWLLIPMSGPQYFFRLNAR